MTLLEIFMIGVGLSMDAFAVSICKGLGVREARLQKALVPGIYFGVFQALMPIIGYYIGASFRNVIEDYDHWVAFVLLLFIGPGMIKDSRNDGKTDSDLSPKTMFPLALATSVDALTIGVSFGVLGANIFVAALLIGVTTFAISTAGFRVGNLFGTKYKEGAEIIGGIILILIGVKILLQHLGIWGI